MGAVTSYHWFLIANYQLVPETRENFFPVVLPVGT
jgi:hypothetical protein